MCCCDTPVFSKQEQRKARKIHICDECKSEITKGKVYVHGSGKEEDRLYSYKLCLACDRDWQLLQRIVDDCCCCIGDLAEQVWEAVDYGTMDPNGRLACRWYVDYIPDPDATEKPYRPAPNQLTLDFSLSV